MRRVWNNDRISVSQSRQLDNTKTFLLTFELAPYFTIMMSLDLDQIDCRGNCHQYGFVDVAFPTWIMALFD